jgi:UDP-galactopyranose mutase
MGEEVRMDLISISGSSGRALEIKSDLILKVDAGRRNLFCFSHLRWDFVYQRPQHLISRFARQMRVFFWEEPVFDDVAEPQVRLVDKPGGVTLAVPCLPHGLDETAITAAQRQLLDRLIGEHRIERPFLWYYTPMALAFSEHLSGDVTIYDCMDDLSAFRGAHPRLGSYEAALLKRADLVFTGGYSLYEAKRSRHADTHLFPSSVDVDHFRPARNSVEPPADQAALPRPRLGFFGVLDERLDQELLAAIADNRPDWQLILVGPVVKIDRAVLPRRPNIHYLGAKDYAELPTYIAGWDVALMPFALNESTQFISPTKTPEYLAAGRPVVSTPIADVVRQYGKLKGVAIARTPEEFIAGAEHALALSKTPEHWLPQADRMLAEMSWDRSWEQMAELIESKHRRRAESGPHTGSSRGAWSPAVDNPICRPPLRRTGFDYMIVGAGLAGSVLAERLAAGAGKSVLLIDRRHHIAGNAYDHYDKAGVLVHRYGPHIFHTNSKRVVDYLSHFTDWRPYEHRVLARVNGELLPIPINRMTVNRFFGLQLSSREVEAFLARKALPIAEIRTSEDLVLSRVGPELYEAFFRGYTRKQWGLDPGELDKSVAGRIPIRFNDDDRYFSDSFQNMPRYGYTHMVENMLDHRNICLMLQADYRAIRDQISYDHLIYTGPIDEFFDYRFGRLPYRSLRILHETVDVAKFQPAAVVNYPSQEVPYTRITEFKQLTGQVHAKTSITYEFPTDEGQPYYPVPRRENGELYRKYEALADATPATSFVGRLATYRYYNMDQVVAQALALYDRLSGRRGMRDVFSNRAARSREGAIEMR